MPYRRALVLGAAALLVTAAVLVGGWWFLVREDAELATNAPDVPQDLVTSASPVASGSAASDGLTFRIIPERSEAAYFVDEQLASLSLPSTAKGATNAVQGQLVLTSDGTSLAPGGQSALTVDLTTLQSDESRRDRRVQQALDTSRFPTATFTASGLEGYDPTKPEGQEQTLRLSGTLDLHGVQKDVTWEVKARREGNVVTGLATVKFRFDDFGIIPPNVANFVSVADEVTLQIQLVAQA